MKHLKILLSLIVVMSFVLTACAPAATEAPKPAAPAATEAPAAPAAPAATEAPAAPVVTEAPAAPAEKVTLVDWGYTGDIQTKLFGELMAKPFMAANPNVTVELLGGVSEDAIAQIKAAQGASPIDTMLLGKPRYLQAMKEGWILPITTADVPNAAETFPNIQEQCAPGAVAWSVEIIGLVYNPKIVAKPESWEDLWKPEYKGKVGMVAPSSNAGFLFLMVMGKMFGSGEGDLDAIWAKLEELKPFVVANNPEALSQLLENEEIGVAINWNTEAAVSITKGFNVEFTMPKPGGLAQVGCYGILKNTAYPDLAKSYINIALSQEFQKAMSEPPWYFAPVNKNVTLSPESALILPTADQYPNLMTIDYDIALTTACGSDRQVYS